MSEAGKCGGMYISYMRSKGDRLEEAIDELIDIARRSKAPAEIYRLKMAGRGNWGKLGAMAKRIEAARAKGLRIITDMYLNCGRGGPRRGDAHLGAIGRARSFRARRRRDAEARHPLRESLLRRGRRPDDPDRSQE